MKWCFLLVFYFGFSYGVYGAEVFCLSHLHSTENKSVNNYCNERGELVRVDHLFADQTSISQSIFYKDGKRINQKIYNSSQVQTFEGDIEELSDGTYIKTSYSITPFRAYIKEKRLLRDIDGQILPEQLALWVYEENESKTNSRLVLYLELRRGTNIPLRKAFYDENEHIIFWEEYILDNPDGANTLDVQVTGVTKFDKNREIVGKYDLEGPITFNELYSDGVWPDSKPLGVVVIDSGFDISHKELREHWYQNPTEIFDGIDNDNNGVVDDVYGINQTREGGATNNLRELFLFSDKQRPIASHGTHVASLAMKGIKEWALAGFAGDFTDLDQIARVGTFIEEHSARFINMSFSFDPTGGKSPPKESFKALENLIKDQSQALFFIAAGNSNSNLDNNPKFPAAWNYKNMIVVGALTASDWVNRPNSIYATRAEYSNYGETTVDIFAPGTDVVGAFPADSQGTLSGTSMATPKTLNVVARVAENFPEVKPQILKAALLLGAYIPNLNEPLPCLSGGVVYEERMRSLLQHYSAGMSLLEAALEARIDSSVLEGEQLNSIYLSQLESYWSKRGLLSL